MSDHDPRNTDSPWTVFEVKFVRGGELREVWRKSVYVRAIDGRAALKIVTSNFSPMDKSLGWCCVATEKVRETQML